MSKWQRLRLPKREGLPPLLYKYSGTSKGYEIYITDLTLLWSEQLSNRQIRKRADEDDTTIDPSEDSEQFKVLLQKIEEALCNSPGSSMALTSGAKPDSLELHLTMKLPAPLRPLKWNTYLSKEPITAATNHLLLPLLREEKDRESHQRTLLDQLKQKDWVLGKLFDKIEVMGIELSTIFPGTSGLRGARKETSLAQAAKYIRGVAPFDEQAWLDEMSKSSPESGLKSNILEEVSGSDSASDLEKVHPPPDGWWGSLDIRSTAAASPEPEVRKETPEPKLSATKDTGQMDMDTASEDDDDEFERQETPPRFKQQQPHKKEPQPSKNPEPKQPHGRKSPSSPSQKVQQKPTKGLGKIGGAKTKPKPKSPSPEPEPELKELCPQPPSTRSSSPDLEGPPSRPVRPVKTPSATPSDQPTDSDAASDQDERHQPTPPQPLSVPKPKEKELQQKKPHGRLGVIDGKKKTLKEPTPPPPAPSSSIPKPPKSASPLSPSQSQQAKPKRAGKLGVIGGSKNSKISKPEPEPEPARRANLKRKSESSFPSPPGIGIRPKQESQEERPQIKEPEPEPEKGETEQQRADRKREELKKQLEAKSKAPVKKKRKF
ncbi:uncharacterized protein EURHEDRAFT_409360 [Aspergillus ruber CBS 135680]|uniref:Non-homologous end-joining factor 1 n=1 Tax=Aspergillus ruber (strain CBS 135680) TaxID=1388766 RepID=A0A017SN95_ASPRC|nr:XLF-domain-containing protein [Aspergillus ruber CBS 135680]EYE98049.1 XLF-domain-containing protein [Aspergillus ruber CBS 135680]